jgi:hypothetical protein
MKIRFAVLSWVLAGAMTFVNAGAPAKAPVQVAEAPAEECCAHGSSTPIGVMFDHVHAAGGFMVGYRYFYSDYSGLQTDGSGVSKQQVYKEGYGAVPTEMAMHMHMLEVMYSPTDWLTLMVMPMYMEMDMTMEMASMMDEHGGGMSMHGGHASSGGTHSHGTSGWGDTNVSAIFKLWEGGHQTLVGALGVSIPTGSVDEKTDGRYTHYMMQLGSGTWDLTPSVTYQGHADRIFWGAQYLAALRMEEQNDSGYRLGNVHQATSWAGVALCDWMSLTGRAVYRHEGQLRGHYDGAHGHTSPPDFQANYGGDTVDLGVGLNVVIPRGVLKGNRFGIEALWPVYQELNGTQLERDFTLVAGWQWSF